MSVDDPEVPLNTDTWREVVKRPARPGQARNLTGRVSVNVAVAQRDSARDRASKAEAELEEAAARVAEATARAAEADAERASALDRVAEVEAAMAGAESQNPAGAKEDDAGGPAPADVYAQLGAQVAEVLRSAGSAADTLRADAEQAATQTRHDGDEYAEQTRKEADDLLGQSRTESAEMRAEADLYARDLNRLADASAKEILDDALEQADTRRRETDEEIATTLSEAEARVEALRSTELHLREGLEAVTVWVQRALNSPFKELPPPVEANHAAVSTHDQGASPSYFTLKNPILTAEADSI